MLLIETPTWGGDVEVLEPTAVQGHPARIGAELAARYA
jgi:hypothetical protein